MVVCLLLMVGGCIFQTGKAVERTVLNATYAERLLRESGISAVLHATIAEQMRDGVAGGADDPTDLMLEQAMTPEWLETQLLEFVEEVLSVVAGERDALTSTIDFSEPKQHLRASSDPRLRAMAGELPDQLSMREMIGADRMAWNEIQMFLSSIRQTRLLMNIVSYAGFIFTFLLCLLLAGLAGGMKWFGATNMITGILFLGLLQIAGMAVVPTLTAEMPEIRATAVQVISGMSFVPIAFAGVGLLMLIIGVILRRIASA